MRRLIKWVLITLLFSLGLTGCYTSSKSLNELGGLMLLDNTQLGRNKAFYSKHNRKTIRNVKNHHRKTLRIFSRNKF